MSQFKRVINKTRNTVLAEIAEVADTARKRSKGLLGRQGLEQGQGMIIVPCSSIHTFFMKFPIDVVFVNKAQKVVAIAQSLPPWRLFGAIFRGELVIELPTGAISKTSTVLGDLIALE